MWEQYRDMIQILRSVADYFQKDPPLSQSSVHFQDVSGMSSIEQDRQRQGLARRVTGNPLIQSSGSRKKWRLQEGHWLVRGYSLLASGLQFTIPAASWVPADLASVHSGIILSCSGGRGRGQATSRVRRLYTHSCHSVSFLLRVFCQELGSLQRPQMAQRVHEE